MAASYNAVMHEIHVLLVDHESDCLINTARLLERCQYRVTFIEFASAAITMLTTRKVNFDLVMANINSPDLHGFKLLQHAVSMDIPIILMSDDDNAFTALRALENGAFLQIKKPVTMEVVRCLWQHVLRERTRRMRERGALIATNYSSRGVVFREAVHHQPVENPNNMVMMKDNNKGKSKKKSRERDDNEEEYYLEGNDKVKRKVCTEWTRELHMKFMDAIHQLGEGRCFPKEILDLMDVPGLTRMQVASHLQKCRNDKWRIPEERKTQPQQATEAVVSSDTDAGSPSSMPRKFGSMPRLGKSSGLKTGQTSGTRSETEIQSGAGQENVGTGAVATNNNTSLRLSFGSMVASTSNPTRSSSTRHQQSDHDQPLFHYQDMNGMVRDFSGLPRDSNPNRAPGTYRFHQLYADQPQSSGVPSTDSRSQWSPETPNYGSDDSETRGRDSS